VFDRFPTANRGEIALRIVRACRVLAAKTVAVFRNPERNSFVPHERES